MAEPRAVRCAQNLINAQISVNRTVYQVNGDDGADDDVVVEEALAAILELSKAVNFIIAQKGKRR